MRNIMFRAWDGCEMIYSNANHTVWVGGKCASINGTDRQQEKTVEYDNVMQFTGLTDCSDSPKDIYEGDIIKVTHFDNDDFISSVIFESGVFALKQRHIDEGEVCPLSCEEHYVVIGNVWENPELLK